MKTLDRALRFFCACAALIAAICMCIDPAQAKPRTDNDSITRSCGPENATKKILIAYDTIHGSTAEVAARIGDKLCDMGFKVDVEWAGMVTDVNGYDCFIVGSAIYKFDWLPDAKLFLKKYYAQLAAKPTAIFIVGASMSEDTPETRAAVQKSFVDPILSTYPDITPVFSSGLFGGAFDLTKGKEHYTLFERIVLRILGIVLRLPVKNRADWRNWETIDAWAAEVGKNMK